MSQAGTPLGAWTIHDCDTNHDSVALTLERYLCIVFSMNPDIRMTLGMAFLAIALNWVVAASMVSIALYQDLYRLNFACIPIKVDLLRYPVETRYTIALGSTGIFLYLMTIPLYIHIYVVVKRSNQQAGVQRESPLARRIAILVGTNLVFFFIPIFLLGLWVLVVKTSEEMISLYSRRTIEVWIPQFCLILNSCLNPLVHAFRNDKFKNALKRNFPLRCNRGNVAPAGPTVPSAGVIG